LQRLGPHVRRIVHVDLTNQPARLMAVLLSPSIECVIGEAELLIRSYVRDDCEFTAWHFDDSRLRQVRSGRREAHASVNDDVLVRRGVVVHAEYRRQDVASGGAQFIEE
jgi:hypothetical protein